MAPNNGKNSVLRASEFSAALNSDNYQAILKSLKEFSRTVKKERRFALALNDDEDFADEDTVSLSDNDEAIELTPGGEKDATKEPPAKKYKKSEEWKKDTASYDVPFVGTAVARGNEAKVVKGDWPTGLVKVYLETSPLALELINDDLLTPNGKIHRELTKRKKTKLSLAISKAHLSALAELLTVAIPTRALQENYSLDDKDNKIEDDDQQGTKNIRFLHQFTKVYLPRLFDILNEETERGRGKSRTHGGGDLLVAPALTVLRHFSMISSSNARLVARFLDEKLIEGVLHVCLRPSHTRKEVVSQNTNENNCKHTKPSRIEAILLATKLLRSNDHAVNTYICKGGSKERKVKPGILYLAFREGLSAGGNKVQDNNDEYGDAVADMLECIRLLLFIRGRNSSNSRLLHNLVSRDALQHLCRLSSYAPVLTRMNTFEDVLNVRDKENELERPLETLGIEARRLLFPLLSDRAVSPFLSSNSNDDQVARSMVRLLESNNAGIELRRFLLHCTSVSPYLVNELFGLLNMPDPKNSFEFISRISFIASVLRNGPSPFICVSSLIQMGGGQPVAAEEILKTILPKKMKGQFIAKALQNGNTFVRLESLKLIIIALERLKLLKLEGKQRYMWDDNFIKNLTSAMFQWLPDIQILLSLRNRFDDTSTNRGGAILTDCLFRVIEAYITMMPEHVSNVAFDWMKLLPDSVLVFNKAHLLVQTRLLKCIQIIIEISRNDLDSLLLSSKMIFEIILSTKSKVVYTMCQKIAATLMINALQPKVKNFDSITLIQDEMYAWITAISTSTLPMFFSMINGILHNSWTQLALVGKAWRAYSVSKNMNFSLLVVASLSSAYNSSKPFALLVGQVLSRCLTNLRDPLPLAAVIAYASKPESFNAENNYLMPLFNYALDILGVNKVESRSRITNLSILLGSYFEKESHFSLGLDLLHGIKSVDMTNNEEENNLFYLSPTRLISLISFLNNTFMFVDGPGNLEERYWLIIKNLLPTVLLHLESVRIERAMSAALNGIYYNQKQRPYVNFEHIDMLILSCPFSNNKELTKTTKRNDLDALFKSRNEIFFSVDERSKLLQISFLKKCFPPHSFERVQLSLISDAKNCFSNTGLQFLVCCFEIHDKKIDEYYAFEYALLETAVNAWLWVAKEAKSNQNLLHRQIKSSLCGLLTNFMKKDCLEAAMILMHIDKIPETLILELCFDFSIEDDKYLFLEIGFLNILLQTNSYQFLHHILSHLTCMGERLSKVWLSGYLDNSIQILLRQIKSSPKMLDSFHAKLAPIVSRRLIQKLSAIKTPVLLKFAPLMNLVCEIYDSRDTISCHDTSLAEVVVRVLVVFRKTKTVQANGFTVKNICSVGFSVLNYLKKRTEMDANCYEITIQLTTELFLLIFAAFPSSLKQHLAQTPVGLPPDTLLAWLISLLEDHGDFDTHLMKKMDASLSKKVCRACLKHGIHVGDDINRIPTLSLRFIGLFLKFLANGKSSLASIDIPSARDLFHMITSHSKFEEVFYLEDKEKDTNKTEVKETVLKLMITCLVICQEEIEIESSTWRALFASSNAGLARVDILVRKLVTVCSKNSIPFMDEFRWHGCEATNENQILTGRFDWLVDILDSTRIRATISRFPYFDKIDQVVLLNDIWRRVQEDSNKSNQIVTQARDGGVVNTDLYSPAFLLPLLLGAINFGICPSNIVDDASSCKHDGELKIPWIFSKTSILFIHRLCEKGVISLCFVSLSSVCEKIRCYAVSILGLILQACNTSEALESASWRDRPQLVMILNSVQRSFVLQKATDKNDLCIPKLTPIAANFLARAALVLLKPDDALYVPINRYFLKSEADHGAFQDTNRLPGFMSLFCSSSEDSNQSRAERMWILQMVCDSLVDASCYRLVASCHAPEMILTSFENVRLSNSSKEAKGAEICLLLESLKCMIDHGEIGSLVHLVKRCGIVSWMSSLCRSKSLHMTFPTERSKISFCKLAKSTVDIVFSSPQLKSSNVGDEMCYLIQPLLSLCMTGCDSGRFHDVYRASFAVLRSISIGLTSIRNEGFSCAHIQPMGASVETCLFVLKISDDSMKELSLQTMCGLPISLAGSSQEQAQNLIYMLLNYFHVITNKAYPTPSFSMIREKCDLIRLVLRRIELLQEKYKAKTSPAAVNIVKMLLVIRCDSRISDIELRGLWSRCLGLFVQNTSSIGNDIALSEFGILKSFRS